METYELWTLSNIMPDRWRQNRMAQNLNVHMWNKHALKIQLDMYPDKKHMIQEAKELLLHLSLSILSLDDGGPRDEAQEMIDVLTAWLENQT